MNENEYLHQEQIIYDGTLAADGVMRVVTKYGELCVREKLLRQRMWEEKFFGTMKEADKLRDEVNRIEDLRRELYCAMNDSLDELFARYDELCKQN